MKVLVVGSGGRCHAIVDALSRSAKVSKIYCARGNAGIASQAECVNIKETDVEALKRFAADNSIDLTVVGPEAALEVGIVDSFKQAGLNIFGPTKSAARIETSKEFAKKLMTKYNIPTADYETFTDFRSAMKYVESHSLPTVLKYDGLAAGKGVVIAETLRQAEDALKDMLTDEKFGHGKVVIEECLSGPEFSFMCFVAGKDVYPMVLSQDHKRAYDGDKGPNTGGMGAYTPLPFISECDLDYAMNHIMRPAAEAMVEEGCPFYGVLYGGLMKTPSGIKVIEFNARFGDPETEVVLPCLQSDIYDIFDAIAHDRKIDRIDWSDKAVIGVVLASKGYPADYKKGSKIENLDNIDGKIYHMGTAMKDGDVVTAGGRVMIVVCMGDNLKSTQEKVNREVAKIKCDNLFYRNDIGSKAFKKF